MKGIDYLKKENVKFKEIHLKEAPKSAQDIERLYGCPLHQVLKTLVFIGKTPVIAVVPGDKRVNMNKLKEATKESDFKMGLL